LASLQPFYDTRNIYNTISCKVGGGTATPDFILNLTPNFNAAVKAEFDAMKKNGASLNKSANDGLEAIVTQKADYRKMLADFNKQIDDFMKTLTNSQDNSEKVTDRVPLARLVAFLIAVGILFLMIVYLLLMLCSLKGKCHNCSTFF